MEIQDLELYQGDTWDIDVTVYGTDDLPVDLTTYNIRSYIRKKHTDPAPTAQFICTKPAPTTGVLSLHLAAATSAGIPKGLYVADVELYYLLGAEEIVHKAVVLNIDVKAEATKP